MWHEGDVILIRGVYNGYVHYVQTARLVKDSPAETALLMMPGAECLVPSGYLHHRYNGWDHWQQKLTNTVNMEKFIWHTNRCLILLEPEKFYSTIYMWNAETDEFLGYYINFQLPFRRTRRGFDTLDLDLDLVIDPSYEWHWKDVKEYQHGIELGGITPEWAESVEQAQAEVTARLTDRTYPLDAAWLNWRPHQSWSPPCLPANWEQAD